MPMNLLFEQLLSAMFQCDERGRLTGDAPQAHILRTADQVFVRFHADLADEAATAIDALARAPRGRPGAWADDYASYISLISRVAHVTAVRAGPLYAFPETLREPPDSLAIDRSNMSLLNGTLDEWLADVDAGSLVIAALSDDRAVSVCASVRASQGVHCAGVETAPEYRGQGFAAIAVTGWANVVRTQGAEPFYATTFDNIASQRVAHAVGLNVVGSEFSIYGRASGGDVR